MTEFHPGCCSPPSSGKGSAQSLPLPSFPWCCCEQGTHPTACELIPQPVSSFLMEGQPLQCAAPLPARVNGKLIPDSHLSHDDLINSNSFGFMGWRVPGFRSALPESKPGQLCLLILEMHSKEKQHPCVQGHRRGD